MALPLETEPLPLRADDGGTIRVGGTRVPLETVVHAFDEGASAEEIAYRFPTLALADVYATITYYLQHPRAVEEYLERQETRGRSACQKIEASQPDRRHLRERLLARRSAWRGLLALRFLVDENFDNRILAGLLRRRPKLDALRVQDAGLIGAEDPVILAWAAAEGRVLLTHDIATIPPFAYERVLAGDAMPGVIEVPFQMPVGDAIEELLLFVDEGQLGDVENQVIYLPL